MSKNSKSFKGNTISGQIFFRETSKEVKSPPGKKIVMFVGMIAVPEDAEIKGEHQYTLCGREEKIIPMTGLTVMNSSGRDLTKQAAGHSIDGLLKQPMWSV